MTFKSSFTVVLSLLVAGACSGGTPGTTSDAARADAGAEQGAAAPSAGAGGSADNLLGTGSSGTVGGAALCAARASSFVSEACAACACSARTRCVVSVAECGAACWDLLGCVEVECGGDTTDTACIVAHCSLAGADAASRAAPCVAACPAECQADLRSLGGPADAGASADSGVVGPAGAADACPGDALSLALGASAARSGDTSLLHDDAVGYCAKGAGGAAEAVYAITTESAGTLSVDLTGSATGFDGVLYVQSSCGAGGSTLACTDQDGTTELLALPVRTQQTSYVFVESRAGALGAYDVAFALKGAACGDGAVNPGEECDFGDVAAGDGCGPTCLFEAPTDASNVCPGVLATIALGQTVTIDGYTVGYTDDYAAPCGAEAGAPDRVFGFNPAANGTLTVTLTSSFDGVLSVYEKCAAPGLFELRLCSDSPRASSSESVSFLASGGSQYFVVVDGYRTGSMGTFQLAATLAP